MAIFNKNIIILATIGMIFSFNIVQAEMKVLEAPDTIGEAGEMSKNVAETGKKELPGVVESLWKDRVLPVWQGMYSWFYDNVWVKAKDWYLTEIKPRLFGEYQKRKEIITTDYHKEKQKMKEEIPNVGKSLWGKFLEIIK